MKSVIAQKIYAGEFPRPSVELSISETVIIAGTPWGDHQALTQLNDTVTEFLSMSFSDHEVTSPFSRLPSLSASENNLRNALLLANDTIFQTLNKNAYTSACEASVFFIHGHQISWSQIGMPHIFLIRDGKIHPLQIAHDLSLEYKVHTPLPSRLIGLEKSWDLEIRSLKMMPHDALLLMTRSSLPTGLLSKKYKSNQHDKMVHDIFDHSVEENEKLPFSITLIA